MTCSICEQEAPCMCKANAALALRKALQQAFDVGLVKDMCKSCKAAMAVEKTQHMVLVWEHNYLAGEGMEVDEPENVEYATFTVEPTVPPNPTPDQDEAVEGQPIEPPPEPKFNGGYFAAQADLFGG